MRAVLVGNQNSGKSTLFNALTGANQKVGNWAGVTVDRKEGIIKSTDISLVDLPGIYSLSPYTAEEEITKSYLLDEEIDVVINIVDATQFERSLYLSTQLLELDCKMVIALNMEDLLKRKGLIVDAEKLAKEMGVPVVSISALKKNGVGQLVEEVKVAVGDTYAQNKRLDILPKQIIDAAKALSEDIKANNALSRAIKMLEREDFKSNFNAKTGSYINVLESSFKKDLRQIIANARYDFITRVKGNVCQVVSVKPAISDKIDKVVLNKWCALPIFATIMFAVYFLSVGVVGSLTVDGISWLVDSFGGWIGGVLEGWGASAWAVSLVVDGIIAGVGALMGFVPQLIILFLCISLLETTGYMTRIAFMFDKIFRKFGLSGKSLIPFIVGSGCSVPAIMSCRTIENNAEKKMTVMLTPFVPCSAKLPIVVLFSGYFFGDYSGIVSASLYFLAVAVIILCAIILNKFFIKGGQTAFLAELPEYKAPNFAYTLKDTTQKVGAFIKRAGTIILLCSIIIWFLSSFSWKFKYGVDIDKSILAGIGNSFAWVFYPMLGEWSWAASVSAIQGLVAKEQVVTSLAIISGLAVDAGGLVFSKGGIFSFFNPASAYAFMVFNLFSAPCFGAIGAMKKELGGTKKMLAAVGFQTAIAWVLACIAFAIGSLIMML